MDIDTINVQSYSHLLKNDLVMGIQEFQNNSALLCNALIFAKKESIFIKKWMESYEEHFDPNGWCEASVHLPYKIYLEHKDLYDFSNILFLHESSFYTPSYKNVDEIFENNMYSKNNIDEKSKDLITLHYWNTFSEKYYHLINDFRYNSNTYYGYLLNNIKLLYTQKYYNDKYTFYDNISIKSCININKLNSKTNTYYTISVILNVDNDSPYNSLYSLLNQDYNEYFSMEIIIIINNNNLQNNTELKDLCKIKNVKITIINLFEHNLLSSLSKYTIGLNLSNNNYILFMDSNDIISSNKIIYQCLKYDSIKKKDYTMLFNNIESINNESSKNYSIFFEKNNVQSNPQNKYYYEEYDLFTDNNIYYDKIVLSKRVNNEMLNNEYIDKNINENKINSFYLNYVNSIIYL